MRPPRARSRRRRWGLFAPIGGRDYARVDVMVRANGEPVVLEVNTLPGMTETSLLPKAAAAVGMSYAQLCQKMIDLALQHSPVASQKLICFGANAKLTNRRLGRVRVLDVKLRSSQVRAARARRIIIALGVCFGTVLGLYAVWCLGEFTLNKLVYENKSFAIQQVEVQTDGVISADQLRRWSGVRPGQNLLALDLAHVKRDLEMQAMIESVSVERILPGTLRLRVTEREPVAQVTVPCRAPGGGLDLKTFQIDANGYVMLPLDPRQRAVPPAQADDQLPLILGINASDLQPGRKLDSAQVQAALKWIDAFESSADGEPGGFEKN